MVNILSSSIAELPVIASYCVGAISPARSASFAIFFAVRRSRILPRIERMNFSHHDLVFIVTLPGLGIIMQVASFRDFEKY